MGARLQIPIEFSKDDLFWAGSRLVETREQYTFKWKRDGWWMEGTNPDPNWTNDHPEVFTLHFKGNTLVDLAPRPKDSAYPSFECQGYIRDQAPMIRVNRFVSSVNLEW